MEEILDFLINYTKELVKKDNIDPNDSLQNDIGVDSLEVAELMVALEKKYDYYLPDKDLIEMDTLKEIAEFTWNAINNPSGGEQ